MKEKMNFGFLSQSYAAPRAESIEMSNEGLLCASPSNVTANEANEGFENILNGTWGGEP